ncbi:Smr/MutS family protein [Limimaricola pyoseonensis]|uniref:DNA-nicking endonuclease, Smr domain n=1 Tax=Limimaricola pyoseonensis TaxID=521013 RepID=A0A1G7ELR4_9RHOB|nr:Smr/MutS family protein [Limimaricola pyoseonensis]SDE64589.1 DNA-nicking endonuclease, Smr domain [Limimaricola pyoseonensis]
MARRPRHLSPEERALWDKVARSADPLDRARRAKGAPPKQPTPPETGATPPAPMPPPDPMPRFRVGEKAGTARDDDLLRPLSERLRRAPVAMDAKAHGRMTRGKLKPEARIDLHGMTLSEAHPELVAFILSSQQMGRRLVLVITGKGRARDHEAPMPVRQGVLRHQVPQWLALSPLKQAVLQVTPAHFRHGGEGAYYVYLRRR